MSGFEPFLLEAGAAEAGTAALASEVMAPELLGTLGAEFGTEAAFSGLGGLEGLTGLTGLAGEGLGGLSSLASGAGSAVPTLAENLATAAPEALGQTQSAILNAQAGANQLPSFNTLSADQLAQYTQGMPQAGPGVNVAANTPGMGGAEEVLNGPSNVLEAQPAPYDMSQINRVPTETGGMPGAMTGTPTPLPSSLTTAPSGLDSLFSKIKELGGNVGDWWDKQSPEKKLLYGSAAGLGAASLFGKKSDVPEAKPYSGPLSKFKYNPDVYKPYIATPPTPYQPQYKNYRMADGGIADLGGYSDGGRMLKGPGDGMSDNIPATIAGKQPARLANEEFVVPADVVSHLGNGSSDAGAKQLYKMMDRVRQARTGQKKQGKEIKADKYLPA